MKTIISAILCCLFVSILSAQAIDSLAIRTVDSLIRVTKDLTSKRDFDQALKVIVAADSIAMERLGEESATYGSCCLEHGIILYYKRDFTGAEKWYLKSMTVWEKALGKDHPNYSNCLNNLALVYQETRQFENARTLYIEAIDILERTLGKDHPDYATGLNNLANIYFHMGQYEKVEPLYLEVKAIRENALGVEHRDYGGILNNLASLYNTMGRFSEAESMYLESLSIREKTLGKEHPEYAKNLNSLANLYYNMGQYDKVESLSLEGRDILERIYGKEHPDYVTNLNTLAGLYWRMGQYEKAESTMLEVKDIVVKLVGTEHPFYSSVLEGLGLVYKSMGQYERAEPLFHEAKAIMERTQGKEHPNMGELLTKLANLYFQMGQYGRAEPLYIDAKTLMENSLGKEHADYGGSLHNLAVLYETMGQYERAESLYGESLTIQEKALGKEHPDYATGLHNLANVYFYMGQYEKAEPLQLESLGIIEKAMGKEHSKYAAVLNNLGRLYLNMGRHTKAETSFMESKAIREKILGKKHPDYAQSLTNLGVLHEQKKEYEKAESLFLEVKRILERVYGVQHPSYIASVSNLAAVYENMGEYEQAELYYQEQTAAYIQELEKSTLHLSEEELGSYLETFSKKRDEFLSFMQKANREDLTHICFDNSLFYKGFLLQSASRIRQLALSDQEAAITFNRLKGCQRRLAGMYSQPVHDRDSSLLAQLESQSNELEKELARTIAGFAEARRQVSWQDVQANLSPGEAAIEFVHYRYAEDEGVDSTMYAALMLKSGAAKPVFVPLFEERSLERSLAFSEKDLMENANHIYTTVSRGGKPLDGQQSLQAEPGFLFQALANELADVRTIYYSPSGMMHRLNMRALPFNDGEIMADRFQLIRLNSTRQLAIRSVDQAEGQEVMLYGGIRYELDSMEFIKASQVDVSEAVAVRGENAFRNAASKYRGSSWQYLPGTEVEVDQVASTLSAADFTADNRKGDAATEESVKAIGVNAPSPRILHLATHGYFFPNVEEGPHTAGESPPSTSVFKMSDHPMIRSGLILAGGNHAWKTGNSLRPDIEDGILTAYEISQLDLSNTELVVLSACETGLGDIKGDEGVYGMQRAFKIAGAKYLIMSLWQVPDQETAFFMQTFYQKLVSMDMDIAGAFDATQDELRKDPSVTPYEWAAFVLVE